MSRETPSQAVVGYASAGVPSRWAERLMAPVGWPFYFLLIIAALCLLWEARNPGSIFTRLLFVVTFGCFGIYWSIRLVFQRMLSGIYRLPSLAVTERFRPFI